MLEAFTIQHTPFMPVALTALPLHPVNRLNYIKLYLFYS